MSQLKSIIQQLIRETIDDHNTINNTAPNEIGTVDSVNDDGTVDVSAGSGVYSGCGTPVPRIVGDVVLLVTADGRKVAL
jgi:hypothetical protein